MDNEDKWSEEDEREIDERILDDTPKAIEIVEPMALANIFTLIIVFVAYEVYSGNLYFHVGAAISIFLGIFVFKGYFTGRKRANFLREALIGSMYLKWDEWIDEEHPKPSNPEFHSFWRDMKNE